MQKQPLLLNRAGRAYVFGSVVLTAMVVFFAIVLIEGIWRMPMLYIPGAVARFVWATLISRPALAAGGVVVVAVIVGGSAYFARRRVNALEQCVGEPKEGVTEATGVLLLLRDVTVGVVVTILEIVSD